MTEKAISPLRQRLIDDMTIRRLGPKTQHEYIRHVKSFVDFLGRSPGKATAEDVHRYQLRLASIGTTVPTVNANASALRFFFNVTLRRSDLADAVVSVREPRRLPMASDGGTWPSASSVSGMKKRGPIHHQDVDGASNSRRTSLVGAHLFSEETGRGASLVYCGGIHRWPAGRVELTSRRLSTGRAY